MKFFALNLEHLEVTSHEYRSNSEAKEMLFKRRSLKFTISSSSLSKSPLIRSPSLKWLLSSTPCLIQSSVQPLCQLFTSMSKGKVLFASRQKNLSRVLIGICTFNCTYHFAFIKQIRLLNFVCTRQKVSNIPLISSGINSLIENQ